MADLRAEIRKNMERELKNALVSRVKQQVINGLIEQNPIDVPASAVEEEINVLRNQAAQPTSVAMHNKLHSYHVNYLKRKQLVVFK